MEEAIKFAEWLQENRWFYFDQNKGIWHYTFEMGTAISQEELNKHYRKTSKELFEKFKSET